MSQNIMHASMTITDGIYANLLSNEVQDIITNLGIKIPSSALKKETDLEAKLTELLELLRQK